MNIVIIGPSGSGKSTVVKKLKERLGLIEFSWSYPKHGCIFPNFEGIDMKNGKIDMSKMNELKFLYLMQFANQHNLIYQGTREARFNRILREDRRNVLIYLEVPKEERIRRMKERNRLGDDIEEKLKIDEQLEDFKQFCDIIVYADSTIDEVIEGIILKINDLKTQTP